MVRNVDSDELLVPEGSRVLHIGPHKTGTTSLQVALYAAREETARQGVRFAGYNRHPISAILAILGRSTPTSDVGDTPGLDRWQRVLDVMENAAEPRTVLSSEFFADANDAAIRRVVDSVGPEAIQVVVTLRPLAKIIPSQWQQFIQSGATDQFDDWLHQIFERPKEAKTFWRRHRHDHLVERWADVVGADRVTAVVVDDADHNSVLRSFEHVVGLETGTLVADHDKSNRSLTLGEVEAVRRFNIAYWTAGLRMAQHTKVMRSGAARYLQHREPEKTEPKVLMPQWALDRAAQVSAEIVSNINALPIHLTGDLDLLLKQPISRESRGDAETATVAPQVAARLAMGVLLANGAKHADVEAAVYDVAPNRDPRSEALEKAKHEAAEEAERQRIKAEVALAQKAAEAEVRRAEQARVAKLPASKRFTARVLRSIARRSKTAATRLTSPRESR